jgi:hypothetical protein
MARLVLAMAQVAQLTAQVAADMAPVAVLSMRLRMAQAVALHTLDLCVDWLLESILITRIASYRTEPARVAVHPDTVELPTAVLVVILP